MRWKKRRGNCRIVIIKCPRCGHDKAWGAKSIAKARCTRCGYEYDERF